MNTRIYLNNEHVISGITLKNTDAPDRNNTALHVGGSLENIVNNRKKLASFLYCSLGDFVCANQTHSANFYKVTRSDKGRGAEQIDTAIPDTDALYTYEPDILLSCFTADCVPVIFYHETKGLIGVIHSGWQGTVKEISLKLFQHLTQIEGCGPEGFLIHLGPALSQEKFEVDEDVYLKFKELGYADEFMYFNENTKKYHIDNRQTVKKQCELVGIPSENIILDETCTYLSPEGFSYRQDKKSGRHLSFIMKKQHLLN